MRRPAAAAGTALFLALAPGGVAGLLPWWLTGWRAGSPAWPGPVRLPGVVLLVVGGLYRYVRNPMYLAVVATIAGQALLLSRPALLGYAAVVWLTVAAFVRWYEEPTLTRRFGAAYTAYRRAVPAWLPRPRPRP